MPRYARETTVPIERSRAEIEETLRKYGATAFHSGWDHDTATIAFRLENLFIRFTLPLPKRDASRFVYRQDRYGNKQKRTEAASEREWDQEIRQRWRALLLVVKAKLEAVDCGISSLEKEFLAFIVMPNDLTLGDWLHEAALPQIVAGQMPRLLEAPKADTKIIDAEVVNHGS